MEQLKIPIIKTLKNRDIISITDLTKDEILHLCRIGKILFDLERTNQRYSLSSHFKNKKLASLFYEPSTRTRASFETAMHELGGYTGGFAGTEGTSVMKKETIRDTVMMFYANHYDAIVMRHPKDGALQWAADVVNIPVINGGDGKNEHPTQSLLDILTIYIFNDEKLDGLNIGFGGDLCHGRTIRSLSLALSHFSDITIHWAAEDFLGMPKDLLDLLTARNVKVIRHKTVKDVLDNCDFYYMTRPQTERMTGKTTQEIMKLLKEYAIDEDKTKDYRGKLMHPLPVNSEIAEIQYPVYFLPCQGFFQQAENGILARKALLLQLLNNNEYATFDPVLKKNLYYGNNKLLRIVEPEKKTGLRYVDDIPNGIAIDHAVYSKAILMAQELQLTARGYISVPADFPPNNNFYGKSILKTSLTKFSERELKKIALISPECTVNYIANGKVAEKFVYLLCQNENCITRELTEDVPPKFYNDNGAIRCRYCRYAYEIKSRKITDEEKRTFMRTLPISIEQEE